MTDLGKQRLTRVFINYIFPLILLLYPLLKVNQGVDYTDSMYSLGNFRFFTQMEGMWVVATFLANVIGFLLMQLPFAGTYLGMRIYTALFISVMALISYFWLRKKMPAWLVFLGEVIAIGFCWCPTTILYNYLTYFFMLLALVFLYEGLTTDKNQKLALAGVFLGCNMMVRFPNVIETGFILGVWLYGILKKKKASEVLVQTVWCMAGYLLGFGILFLGIVCLYGGSAYGQMMQSLFTMTDTATSYSPTEMILSCIREYVKGLIWPLSMTIYTVVTALIFQVKKGQYLFAKKSITVAGILVLFRLFYAKGMFNIDYTTYPSMFQWCTTFTLLAIALGIAVCFHKQVSAENKLMYILVLLVIGITPIGSNNNLYPIFNNLFLIAPITLFGIYQIIKKAAKWSWGFPLQAMLTLVVLAVLIQSIGFGTVFVFRGADNDTIRDTKIQNNEILKGMYTNAEKAEAIEGLTSFCKEKELTGADKSILLFGTIPGVTYFLDTPCAIFTSWPDLESNTYARFQEDMEALGSIQEAPTVILGEDFFEQASNEKKQYLWSYMENQGYQLIYDNARFRVYQKEGQAND